jgi:hypothetical protein
MLLGDVRCLRGLEWGKEIKEKCVKKRKRKDTKQIKS